jgi:hypothetical protein
VYTEDELIESHWRAFYVLGMIFTLLSGNNSGDVSFTAFAVFQGSPRSLPFHFSSQFVEPYTAGPDFQT